MFSHGKYESNPCDLLASRLPLRSASFGSSTISDRRRGQRTAANRRPRGTASTATNTRGNRSSCARILRSACAGRSRGGLSLGLGIGNSLGCSTPKLIAWLQIAGTCLLLWGTLFVRGWNIQTYGGVTLTERVNQWLYRTLYCVGTAVLVSSLAWPQWTGNG